MSLSGMSRVGSRGARLLGAAIVSSQTASETLILESNRRAALPAGHLYAAEVSAQTFARGLSSSAVVGRPAGATNTDGTKAGTLVAAGLAAIAGLVGGIATAVQSEAPSSDEGKKKLPTICKAEVAKHTSKENGGIWVTYLDGVYDVTEFVAMHPGGTKILLAAGKSIGPYWAMYAIHKTDATREILEEYRIGNLPPNEVEEEATAGNAYANEPKRNPALKVLTETPFNAESPIDVIEAKDVTPVEMHFKRHHLPVPLVEPEAYELEILGDLNETTLTLDDIKKLPKHTVTMTLQCSGNRRTEMVAARTEENGLPPVRGLAWTNGAISTAEWSGAKLRDVLVAAGLTEDMPGGPKHIIFVGLDVDATGERYEASIPIEKALSAYGDVLLAYEMNGETLTRDHGYPLRALVPGNTAARSVKWVYKIIASEDECDGFWQANDYKAFTPSQDPQSVDWTSAKSLQEFPVTSFMTTPISGDKIPAGSKSVEVKGIAVAGGGRAIGRVDVSSDGGATWKAAELAEDEQKGGRAWAWRRFTASVEVPEGAKEVELICKATDEGYNAQPDDFAAIYNFRGIVANAWQRVKLEVEP